MHDRQSAMAAAAAFALLNYDYIMGLPQRTARVAWTRRDAVIYNLGIGLGAAAIQDERLLDRVREETATPFPTMLCSLSMTGGVITDPASGIDFTGALHGEEVLHLNAPLRAEGSAMVTSEVEAVWDNGPDRGAILALKRSFIDQDTGQTFATIRSMIFLRNNGGFGGNSTGRPAVLAVPDRPPDGIVDASTEPQQALIFRLSGDRNPLHSDPAAAQRAGFPRPILMGLCSFAIAGHTLARGAAQDQDDVAWPISLRARFTGPVFPGDTIRIDHWRLSDGETAFRAHVPGREGIVMNGGRARFVPAHHPRAASSV